jgi:adenine-specific DNA-methyltransferase
VRYFGSKSCTLPRLGEVISSRVPKGVLCDAFGGIGTVGAYFKTRGYEVWTGDVLLFAHFFQVAKIHRQRRPGFRGVARALGLKSSTDVLNSVISGRQGDGWFVQNYAKERKFFTLSNARAIERTWKNIIAWEKAGYLSYEEKACLMASLIQAMDRVANTAGTYYAFLKTWHRKANKRFSMDLLPPATGVHSATCLFKPARELVAKRKFDILYLDPPYNERSYGHYYHLPETIAQGAEVPVHGKSGIPDREIQRSAFNDPATALNSLNELLRNAKFRWLAFHYADDGLISRREALGLLSEYGKPQEFILRSKGYTTQKTSRQVNHRLYLLKCE